MSSSFIPAPTFSSVSEDATVSSSQTTNFLHSRKKARSAKAIADVRALVRDPQPTGRHGLATATDVSGAVHLRPEYTRAGNRITYGTAGTLGSAPPVLFEPAIVISDDEDDQPTTSSKPQPTLSGDATTGHGTSSGAGADPMMPGYHGRRPGAGQSNEPRPHQPSKDHVNSLRGGFQGRGGRARGRGPITARYRGRGGVMRWRIWMRGAEFAHYCKLCDKGFTTEDRYTEHCETHEKCPFCPYTAADKLIEMHVEMQHNAGRKFNEIVWGPNTVDEVAQWRNERKRNYPTRANVMRKLMEAEAKRQRGELFGLVGGGSATASGNRSSTTGNSNMDYIGLRTIAAATRLGLTSVGIIPEQENPLDRILDKESSDEEDSSKRTRTKSPEPEKPRPAAGLVAYGSGSSSEDDANADDEDDEGQEKDNGKQRGAGRTQRELERIKNMWQPRAHPRARRPANPFEKGRRSSTLLEMLLSDEIRHERNVFMQCIYHICRNNFFDEMTMF